MVPEEVENDAKWLVDGPSCTREDFTWYVHIHGRRYGNSRIGQWLNRIFDLELKDAMTSLLKAANKRLQEKRFPIVVQGFTSPCRPWSPVQQWTSWQPTVKAGDTILSSLSFIPRQTHGVPPGVAVEISFPNARYTWEGNFLKVETWGDTCVLYSDRTICAESEEMQ